mmetsp:Transcript_35567/g.53843  ORF Transcript_35567/g.53843 Transcript_35567/m.53843 type:complete len:277 (-) Transcript_35567:1069-1899(-)
MRVVKTSSAPLNSLHGFLMTGKFMFNFLSFLYISIYLIQPASAADITLKSFSCNEDLSIYATKFHIGCNNVNAVCTLGEMVTVYGKLIYSNIQSKYAYLSLSTSAKGSSLPTAGYDDKKVNLCSHASSSNGACYEDGDYSIQVYMMLPSFGEYDWFITGLTLDAHVELYDDNLRSNLLGHCTASFEVTVTPGAAKYFDPPSRGVVEAGAVVLAGSCFFIFMFAFLKMEYKRRQCGMLEDKKISHGFQMMLDRKRKRDIDAYLDHSRRAWHRETLEA